jgi:hypothetical protein
MGAFVVPYLIALRREAVGATREDAATSTVARANRTAQ